MKRPPARIGGAKSQAKAKGKFYLTYPKRLVREPLIYHLSRKFDVVFNVRGASVNEDIGIIALELDGDAEIIEAAVAPSSRSCPRPPTSGRMICRAQRSMSRAASVIR